MQYLQSDNGRIITLLTVTHLTWLSARHEQLGWNREGLVMAYCDTLRDRGNEYLVHKRVITNTFEAPTFDRQRRGEAREEPVTVRGYQETIQLSGAYATRQTS
jgi:hypothetical protein